MAHFTTSSPCGVSYSIPRWTGVSLRASATEGAALAVTDKLSTPAQAVIQIEKVRSDILKIL
jgi:hypothetical protein